MSSIRAARAALGWSQPVLADKAGVSLVALARLEAGSVSPRLATIAKLKTAIEGAGIRIADDHPAGGYTLTATEVAVKHASQRTEVGEPVSPAEQKTQSNQS